MTQKLNLLAPRLLLSLLALFTVSTAWADVFVTSYTKEWTNGNKYIVNSNVTISDRITVNGTVTLQLCDGCTLTASEGIEVGSGATLTIEGESKNTGTLISTGTSENAGIGAYAVGTIIINGGTIQATGGYGGAGIGGSIHSGSDGTITINGGIVTATGGEGAAGIGGGEGVSWGDAYGKCGTITINGGQVTATGGKDAPGIGPGYDSDDNTSGSLTLGWTNATDFISVTGQSIGNYCGFSNRLGSISFAKDFLIAGVGVANAENIKKVASVRLVPLSDDAKRNLSSASITGINPVYHYTGSDISVQYTVKDAVGNTLTEGTHYEVAITLNNETATAVNAVGNYTLTFKGKGEYTGSQTVNFEVVEYAEGLFVDNSFSKGETGYYYVNMPATGSNTVTLTTATVTTFKVYDDGGKSGNYSDECSGTLILTAPAGYVLQLSGSIKTESVYDKLTVYDGNSASDSATKLLDAMSSTSTDTETPITTVVSTGQSMTLYFYSSQHYNTDGLNLTVTLVDATYEFNLTVNNSAMGGSVAATVGEESASAAKVGDVVTLTATPSEGYVLCDLSVKDGSGNDVAVTDMLWYTGMSTATFTMPASAATVTPTFTNTLTADGGLYINLPKSGTKTVTIPTGVQSFKVYDDGGANGKYSNYGDGTLALTAPDCVLQLSGSIITENVYDKLTVYDGNSASAAKLLDAVGSTNNGTERTIPTVSSTGQSMTLRFKSDENNNYDGLNLTVTLVKIMELADNADNTLAINGWQNGLANVTLKDRTLYKDGKWNTLCLPFDVTIAGSPLDGATARTVTGASISDATLNLTFGGEVTELVAGTPYIIKWASDTEHPTIVSPVFNGVTITAAEPGLYDNQAADDLRVRFVGTYKSTTFDSQDMSILLMGAGNTLYYPAAGAGIGSFRAYFKIGSDGALQAPRLTSFNINFDDDDSTTGIIDGLSPAFSQGEGAWYSIDGRKLDGQPTQHGIYINNGKKVVIK